MPCMISDRQNHKRLVRTQKRKFGISTCPDRVPILSWEKTSQANLPVWFRISYVISATEDTPVPTRCQAAGQDVEEFLWIWFNAPPDGDG